jgi:HK97 family phage prohead protease
MNHRAYSALHVKDVSESGGFVRIKGIASTPTVDRMGDSVNPMGASFKTPMPLLWQHKHDQPVGHVVFAKPTRTGIPFEAQIPVIKEEGVLKQRVDEAIHSLKYQLVAFVSIGFSAVQGAVKRLESGGLSFEKWDWHELSLVTIPANPDAVLTSVKALGEGETPAPLSTELISAIQAADITPRAAPGQPRTGVRLILKSPGASGTTTAARRGSVLLIPNPKKAQS